MQQWSPNKFMHMVINPGISILLVFHDFHMNDQSCRNPVRAPWMWCHIASSIKGNLKSDLWNKTDSNELQKFQCLIPLSPFKKKIRLWELLCGRSIPCLRPVWVVQNTHPLLFSSLNPPLCLSRERTRSLDPLAPELWICPWSPTAYETSRACGRKATCSAPLEVAGAHSR